MRRVRDKRCSQYKTTTKNHRHTNIALRSRVRQSNSLDMQTAFQPSLKSDSGNSHLEGRGRRAKHQCVKREQVILKAEQ